MLTDESVLINLGLLLNLLHFSKMRRSQEPSDMLLTFGDNKRSYLLYAICFHQALKGYGLFLKILSFSREILYLVRNLKLYSYIFHCILIIFEKVIHFNYFFKSDSLAWLKTILFLTFQCLTPWCNGFFYPVFLLTANPTSHSLSILRKTLF